MNERPNCYQCIHHRSLPGDAHSRCAHPRIPMNDSPVGQIMAIFQEMTSGIRLQGVPPDQAIHVTGDRHGIARGWFFWPANFDPTWLTSCDGFEKVKNEKTPVHQ